VLNRVLVLEALFGFTIAIVFYSVSSANVSAAFSPGDRSRPHLSTTRVAQVRVAQVRVFDDPAPGQHRPVVVKRAEHGKECHKSETKAGTSGLEARNEIVERHVGQCHKAGVARRLEERRRELESQQITPVAARP
jgi:hypothetical protein